MTLSTRYLPQPCDHFTVNCMPLLQVSRREGSLRQPFLASSDDLLEAEGLSVPKKDADDGGVPDSLVHSESQESRDLEFEISRGLKLHCILLQLFFFLL